MSSLLSTTWTVLAPALDPVPQPEDVNPGWVAVIVVVSLIVVTVLLWFSLRKQLGKVRMDDDPAAPTTDTTERDDSDPA